MVFRPAVATLLALTASAAADPDATLLPHPDAPWWVSAQGNAIMQAQPGFHSPYRGTNSFRPADTVALSLVGTVFAGYEITRNTAVIITGESAGGGGLSDALGIAGFTNLDVVRNPTLGPTPYIGRAFVEQVVPLSGVRELHERDPLHILRTLPSERLTFRAGKLSTADVFDVNTIGTDSHLQFMNWSIDNNGAWDYAADTRGYTLGATAELTMPSWSLRAGSLLMPTVANGIDYDFHVKDARGDNVELELRNSISGHPGVVRLLGWWNHAKMGSYALANAMAQPDITASREAGRSKVGVGLNVEQEINCVLRGFGRVGWNDGKNESFAYTEIDNTVTLGVDLRGTAWHRSMDKLGIAAVTNGISKDHRTYLALGGKGFLLGDGRLTYGREDIVEAYYTARVYRGVFPAVDLQVIENPGYNKDRGPVLVGSLRLHVEI